MGAGPHKSQWTRSRMFKEHLGLISKGKCLLLESWQEEQILGLGNKEVTDKWPNVDKKEITSKETWPKRLCQTSKDAWSLDLDNLDKNALCPCSRM